MRANGLRCVKLHANERPKWERARELPPKAITGRACFRELIRGTGLENPATPRGSG